MCRFTGGGFVQTAITLQITNATLPHLSAALRTAALLLVSRAVRRKIARTTSGPQTSAKFAPALEWLAEQQRFPVEDRLAQALLTVVLSILYSPIIPASPLIGAAGMLLHVLADWFMARQAPRGEEAHAGNALRSIVTLLDLVPLVQVRPFQRVCDGCLFDRAGCLRDCVFTAPTRAI